jgi:luciferase family oxidoreductase group 1
MSDDLTLSVVDQSPVRQGGTAADALRESVRLAQHAERLGYARYWVAEHHNSGGFAGTSPEILIGQIAAATRSIRVGSGGVMLSHYSALKVAEQFRMLESFFPGRIDLGIGRAPGSDQLTAAALAYPRPQVDVDEFPQQVVHLLGFLEGALDPSDPFAQISVQPGPQAEAAPQIWLLGSSDYSAQLAALLGLPFAFADFFGHTGGIGPRVAELYREKFRPTRFGTEPRVNVTVQVVCAPTHEEAVHIAWSRRFSRAARVLGIRGGLLPPDEAAAYPLSDEVRRYVDEQSRSAIDGTPEEVRERILSVAATYGTTDVGVVTNCYAFEDRARSFELVAEAFGLTPRDGDAPMDATSKDRAAV